MSLAEFNCQSLEVSFQFSKEDFDEDSFLKAAGVDEKEDITDEDGDIFLGLSFGAKEQDAKYHAHMRVRLFKEHPQRIDIIYHDGPVEFEDLIEPPNAEDLGPWLGSFFKTSLQKAAVRGEYIFDKTFLPVVFLPFPLISPDRGLAGTLVTGVSFLLPKETPETAIIQDMGEGTHISFMSRKEFDLKTFKLQTVLEQLSGSINPLIKRTGEISR